MIIYLIIVSDFIEYFICTHHNKNKKNEFINNIRRFVYYSNL